MNSVSNTPFATVAEAYNRYADKYDEFIENNPNLQRMRHKVYAHVTSLLSQGSRILDLACGTGTDAFWFAQHGYSVPAVSCRPCPTLRDAIFGTGSATQISHDDPARFDRMAAATRYTVFQGDCYFYGLMANGM